LAVTQRVLAVPLVGDDHPHHFVGPGPGEDLTGFLEVLVVE
jgi:hypothetical protein